MKGSGHPHVHDVPRDYSVLEDANGSDRLGRRGRLHGGKRGQGNRGRDQAGGGLYGQALRSGAWHPSLNWIKRFGSRRRNRGRNQGFSQPFPWITERTACTAYVLRHTLLLSPTLID